LTRSGKIVVIGAALLCATGAIVFVAGAYAAEGALHPARLPVALVCPCLAHERCESIAVKASDGVILKAWYYMPEKPIGKAVILLHGVGSNRQDMVALGSFFVKRGYTALEPDLRGHGESGGIATYGIREGGDVSAWLNWLRQRGDVSKIYGFGASLGGAVLLQSLEHETRFRAVVAESPYYDFPSIADERIARMLPNGAKWIARPLVASGLIWARWKDSIELRRASPADGLRSTAVPVLLVHGLADDKTSPENSRRLAVLRPGNPDLQLWLVPNSHHADAWKTATSEFETRVTGWFDTH